MRDIEVRLRGKKDSTKWYLEVYDPNIQHVIAEEEKNFDTPDYAGVWLEAFTDFDKTYDLGDSLVLGGSTPYAEFDLEKMKDN
jgi:hypothetical protein